METNAVLVALNPLRATTASCDGFVLFLELAGSLGECLAGLQLAEPLLRTEFEVPILGDVLGTTEAALLRAFAPLLAVEVCSAMPATAFCAAVEADFIA